MKKTIPSLLALSALLVLGGCTDKQEKEAKPTFMFWCFRKEIVSADYHIPKMETAKAAAYIQEGLKKMLPGIVSTRADLASRTLTVSYKSSTIRKMNIEDAIARMGFAVNYRPADPRQKPPKGLFQE